jgi:hypothetical protein
VLPRRETDLDAADTFLPFVLGIVSSLRRLEPILQSLPAGEGGRREQASGADRRLDEAAIGAIALALKIRAVLADQVPLSPFEPRAADVGGSSMPIRALLR